MERSQANMKGVIAYVQVSDAKAAADFYKVALAAEEVDRKATEDGRLMHCHLQINGGALMLSDPFPEYGHPLKPVQSVTLHIASDDPRSWWKRAVEGGVEVVSPLKVEFWGDLYGQFKDPFGLIWGVVGPDDGKGA